jgi:toxin ParE1/3/4
VARYRLTTDAQHDLNAIGDFILRDNPARSVSFVDELIARFRIIAERPMSFRARGELSPGLRSATHGNYLILFRVERDFVKILGVVHGARDLPRLLPDRRL